MKRLLYGSLDPAAGRRTGARWDMPREEKMRRYLAHADSADAAREMLEPDLGDAGRELGNDDAGPFTDLGDGCCRRQRTGSDQ